MKNKILFVLSLLFGLMFINAGLNKFFNYMPVPDNLPESLMKEMGALMQIKWMLPLIAFAEIMGGLLFILPRTRALAALILFPVMVGIMLINTVTHASGLPMALVLLAILLWAMYENREKYWPLVR